MAVRATAVLTLVLSFLGTAYGEAAGAPQAPRINAPRIGVLGALRMGFGGALTRAGIPFEYVTVPEHQDAKSLARYDLLLVAAMNHGSEPWLPQSPVQRAMDAVKKLPPFPESIKDSERSFTIEFNLKAKRLLG